MKIDGRFARNIDFEVTNLKVPEKTRRKTSILKLQSVKIGGRLAKKVRFFSAHVSCLESLVFLWRRRVYELQNRSFSKASKQVVITFFRGRRGTL